MGIIWNSIEEETTWRLQEYQMTLSDESLEEKVIQVLSEIQVNVSSSDIEACHRIGKS